MKDIPPSLREAIEAVGRDRTHGAAWLARETANVMTRAARESSARTPRELLSTLREVDEEAGLTREEVSLLQAGGREHVPPLTRSAVARDVGRLPSNQVQSAEKGQELEL